MKRLPIVLLTVGDPTGCGPEIAVKAALDFDVRKICQPVLIGAPAVITDAVRRVGAKGLNTSDTLHVGDLKPGDYQKGTPCAAAGRHTVEVAREAVRIVQKGDADAICSAPSSKVSLHLAGYKYRGLSDLFKEVSGEKDYASMLVLDRIRLVLATAHIPFHSVPGSLKKDRIVKLIRTLNESLVKLFGIPFPRIAVAALNPHAGENGIYGREEIETISPAIQSGKERGLAVFGPIAADFLVPRVKEGEFDGAVMMYHDQAHIPLKAIGLYKTATLLLGLPIIRTSVAHGTVYDKAKSGLADPSGMIYASQLAAQLVNKKR
jgi:4-hydroxythreonine-4-phosphate dehydrogenase